MYNIRKSKVSIPQAAAEQRIRWGGSGLRDEKRASDERSRRRSELCFYGLAKPPNNEHVVEAAA